jgi:hypothetical protein
LRQAASVTHFGILARFVAADHSTIRGHAISIQNV